MRYFILILFLVYLSNGATSEHDALDILIQNKEFIQNKLNIQKPFENKSQEHGIGNWRNDSINNFFQRIEKPYSDKEAIDCIKSIYKRFFYFFVAKIGGTSEITDSINIRILSNLLRSTNDNSEWAADMLMKKTTFDALKINSLYIIKNLKNSKLTKYIKYSLMRYLVIGKEERDSILIWPGLTFDEKASISDFLLDSLIKLYKAEDTAKLKASYARQLMETGKRRAVKAALEDFCAPVFEIQTYQMALPCTTSSLQAVITMNLWRYNSDVPLYDSTGTIRDNGNDPALLKRRMAFWKTFKNWVFQNYNITLQDSMPKGFFKWCGRNSISHRRP